MKLYLKIIIAGVLVAGVSTGIYFLMPQQKAVAPTNNNVESPVKLPEPKDTEVTFLAVGDMMLSRNVAGQIKKNDTSAAWPFLNISSFLLSTDFNFGNLESPYTGRNDFNPSGSLVFNAPTWTLPGLVKNNFKVLNLANNHAMDQGLEGLTYTKKILEDNDILALGVGANQAEAWQGKVFTAKEIKIGFIGASYTSLNDGGVAKNNYIARIQDLSRLKTSIADLKTRSDFIVVTMHAGTEYVRTPNAEQTVFAQAAIDYGADMVIGAHSHWVQTIEQYKNKYIFYGLGNFVFDQEWSQDTKEGLMLKISLAKSQETSIKQVELIPVVIENYGQPRPATDIEKNRILKKIDMTTDVIIP